MNEPVTSLRSIKMNPDAPIKRLSASLDQDVERWVRKMEYLHEVSPSAVVEIALLHFMQATDEQVGDVLTACGASKRRR